MVAVVGWASVDGGLRLPGKTRQTSLMNYSSVLNIGFESIPNSLAAHTAAVENGSLGYNYI